MTRGNENVAEKVNFQSLWQLFLPTVEPRFNEPLYNEVLGMTDDFLQPEEKYNKMYGTEPRYNEHNP